MPAAIKNLSDFRARLSWLVLCAPENFPINSGGFGDNQRRNLDLAFLLLNEGLEALPKKLRESTHMPTVLRLLNQAHAAYIGGEEKEGAHLIQDVLNIVAPGRFTEYAARKGESL